MLTILEYVLFRLGLGRCASRCRAFELVGLAALWALGVLLRLVLRPLARELAYMVGRLRGHSRLAARDRAATR
jgi:hypothetical protein